MNCNGNDPEKYYFWAIAFLDAKEEGMHVSTVYLWDKDKKLTKPRISESCSASGCAASALLLSASYLGYMSLEEFQGPPMPEGSEK
jgi:hypothetical protein